MRGALKAVETLVETTWAAWDEELQWSHAVLGVETTP